MVDFRYHLVSLGAVFIALAVGIILGAGPLQNSIGNALNSQVDSLSTTNEQLKADNEELSQLNAQQEIVINDIAPTLVDATLTDRTVGIVVIPGATDDDVTAARDRLTQAGAVVATEVSINEVWTVATSTSYRTTFASQLQSYVSGVEADADANTVLSSALNQVLRVGGQQGDSSTVAELLTGSDDPMVTLVDGEFSGVEAVLIIAPDTDQVALEEAAAEDSEVLAQAEYNANAYSSLVGISSQAGPTVVAGAADSASDVVRVVRDSGVDASTVDNLPSAVGSVNVVVAVAAELNDALVHLGYQEGANRVIGERTEALKPEPEAADGTDPATDGETSEGDQPANGDQPADGTEPTDEASGDQGQ